MPSRPRSSSALVVPTVASALLALAPAACGHPHRVERQPSQAALDLERHREPVEDQVQPFLDAELVSGLVVGLYDSGKTEVYGFGKGPGQGPPNGATLFELGPVSTIYTAILLADAVQRREVDLDTPIAELLPPGVTVPVRDQVAVTLKHLAMHSSGLPRQPPSVAARGPAPDPYGGYGESALYNDLIASELVATPGTQIAFSTFGTGLLGFALGRKIGGGYPHALDARVLRPLGLKDTFVGAPSALAARRAAGTNDDLAKAAPWTFDALAGAGAVVSSANDQLRLIAAELDAAAGGSQALRRAMKLTQEPQLDHAGENEGLGWVIDSAGRYWHNGSTGGFHAFVGFDPKSRHGVVLLASTSTALIDRLAEAMYKILDGGATPPVKLAGAAELAAFAGNYELSGTTLQVIHEGKRLYLAGPGEPRHRLSPISDHEFWLDALQSVAVFEKEGDRVARVVFGVGDHTISAARVDAK